MRCPNCGHAEADGARECSACQVIFEKWALRGAPPQPAGGGPVQAPPYFMALACMTWSSNRLYRVYHAPGELLFIWAGSGDDVSKAFAMQGGLLGYALAATLDPTSKNQERARQLDASKPGDLVFEHEHSFRAAHTDVEEASLEPRSWWLAMAYMQPAHVGVLRLRHRERGSFQCCLMTAEDMKLALQRVPEALGASARIAARWDGERFVSA
ncbi:MAG: hypothetical protein HY553_18240 [Elusimicrobia bacterium]|nr:hypothetical protein [Elusimicrobiota bacterium]